MDDLLPDLCDVFPNETNWLPLQWQSYGGKSIFYGEITTIRCYHDNSYVAKLVNQPGQGRVLFVDGGGSCQRALLGDRLAQQAVDNGWEGIIVVGAVRDIGTLATLPLGIMALGACPIKTAKRDLGEQHVALRIANVVVAPDYAAYADLNGVVISKAMLDLSKV